MTSRLERLFIGRSDARVVTFHRTPDEKGDLSWFRGVLCLFVVLVRIFSILSRATVSSRRLTARPMCSSKGLRLRQGAPGVTLLLRLRSPGSTSPPPAAGRRKSFRPNAVPFRESVRLVQEVLTS